MVSRTSLGVFAYASIELGAGLERRCARLCMTKWLGRESERRRIGFQGCLSVSKVMTCPPVQ